jgi:putative effector of murein hydrolase LrgA (UPF0299 family)
VLAIDLGSTVVLPVAWQTILALFVPIVTALVVKFRGSDKKIHILVSLVLSGALAVWALLADDVPNDTVLQIMSAFIAPIVVAVTSYLTVGKAIAVNEKLAPNKGV